MKNKKVFVEIDENLKKIVKPILWCEKNDYTYIFNNSWVAKEVQDIVSSWNEETILKLDTIQTEWNMAWIVNLENAELIEWENMELIEEIKQKYGL